LHPWRVSPNPKTDVHTHRVAPGFGHALLTPFVVYTFKVLGVSAAVHHHGETWFPIHDEPDVVAFDRGHAATLDRGEYNAARFAEAARGRRIVRGEHAGYWDLFVPITVDDSVVGTLVTGPFARARPTSEGILARWHALTGRRGHLGEPEFAAYVSTVLGTLVLDDARLERFERLLHCLSLLMAGRGDAAKLVNETEAIHVELSKVRLVERTWQAAREMIDERFTDRWQSERGNLSRLGLSRFPDQVLVGLNVGLALAPDPVDEVLRRDALQRRAVGLARSAGDVIAGQVGDHGIALLSSASGTRRQTNRKILDLAERTATVARRELDLSLHFGASHGAQREPLHLQYRSALAAAQSALGRRQRLVMAEAGSAPSSLRELRRELGHALEERADSLEARFDRYLEVVAAESGYRIDAARGHLEAGFERIAEPLVSTGALDARSHRKLCESLDRSAQEAQNSIELFASYRRAVRDLSAALQRPVRARRDRGLAAAFTYIREHYAEPLRLGEIARRAGFAAGHLSKLFIEREGMSFQHYLRKLRLERAKHLLADTDLRQTRIAELSGFGNAAYFSRVFRQMSGMTAGSYRQHAGAGRRSGRNTKTS
jgi:two-component system response regulator YesN